MEAYCAQRHQWSLAAVGRAGSIAAQQMPPPCPVCGDPADVVECAGGLQIDFALPNGMRPLSGVLLVDGSERRREALAARLNSSDTFTVVGHAADGIDALELAGLLRPDAILLAHRMPRLDGFASIPLLRAAAVEAVIVYHEAALDLQRITLACQRGADACVGEKAVLNAAVPTLQRLLGHLSLRRVQSGAGMPPASAA